MKEAWSMLEYDVIIVGAGPAGIFAAGELSLLGYRVLLLDKGRDLDARRCPVEVTGDCAKCSPCSIVCGFGGAGAFSDGKLTLSPDVGGWLNEFLSRDELIRLIRYVDQVYLQHGAPDRVYAPSDARLAEVSRKAMLAELQLIPAKIRHLGTGYSKRVLSNMRQALMEQGVTIRTLEPVTEIISEDGKVVGVITNKAEYKGEYVVLAPGREGADWLVKQARRLNMQTEVNSVDIGVRVEAPAVVMEPLTDDFYESKLVYHSRSFDDRVRTFCVCPYGKVAVENNGGLITVNGHSHSEHKTDNTNFAILVSKNFTEPFKEPITYGQHIARLANLLGGGVLVQRLGDLLDGRRSTESRISKGLIVPTLPTATPGDLSLVLPYRYLVSIMEMLQAMDKLAPGLYARNTLLYGIEVKFYSSRLQVDRNFQTNIENLYAIGDGAGVTRGLMQASVSGVLVSRAIASKKD